MTPSTHSDEPEHLRKQPEKPEAASNRADDTPKVTAVDPNTPDAAVDPNPPDAAVDPLVSIMLDCLHQNPERFPSGRLARLSPEAWKQLFELTVEHRVVPLMYHRLTEAGVPGTNTNSDERNSAAKSSIASSTPTKNRDAGNSSSNSADASSTVSNTNAAATNPAATNAAATNPAATNAAATNPAATNAAATNAADAMQMFHAYTAQVARNNLRYYGELRTLLGRLNHRGIPAILLKGIHLAESIYHNPGMREMNDMDILFRREDLRAAWEILAEMGYGSDKKLHFEPVETSGTTHQIPTVTRHSHHLPRLLKEEVAALEIHWNITRPGRGYSIEPDELWEHAEPATVAGEKARVLDPEDLLLHLCLHTSHQHMFSFGMRPFCDIAETVRHFDDRLDWNVFADRAVSRKWDRGVFLALLIARDFTGAAIPEEVLDRLRPADYKPRMAETAKAQILTEKETAATISPSMVQFAAGKGIPAKIRTVWRRIFLPEDIMITMYPFRPGSPKRYLYYIVRFWQVLKQHTARVLRLSRGDADLVGIVRRKQTLARWMDGG